MLLASSEGRAWVRFHASAKPRRKTGGEGNQPRNISRLFARSAPTQCSGKHQWLEVGWPAVTKQKLSVFCRACAVSRSPRTPPPTTSSLSWPTPTAVPTSSAHRHQARLHNKFLRFQNFWATVPIYKKKDDWSPHGQRPTSLDSYNHVDFESLWFEICHPSQFWEISTLVLKVSIK